MAKPRLSERQVRLPGAAQRCVSVFGLAPTMAPRAMPSSRADRMAAASLGDAGAQGGAVLSPMDGVVAQTPVLPGAEVAEGATVLILEAMKMEVVVPAPRSGVVRALACAAGDNVAKGQVLIEIADG